MILFRSRVLIALSVCVLTVSCSPLGVLNTVVPKDGNTERVVKDVNYGGLPRQSLDVYVPRDAQADTPVVMFIYGGSWRSGRKADYAFVGHALNARGFIVVIPDYRLVPDIRYPDFLHDGVLALQWIKENIGRFGGQVDAVHLAGHSAGAYNAVMISIVDSWSPELKLDPPDVASVVALAGPYDFLPIRFASTRAAFKGVKDLESTQPVNLISSNSPPLLLLTGADDELVSPQHSKSLFDAGVAKGAEIDLKTYPEIGHVKLLLALSRAGRKFAPVLNDMDRFFRQHTQKRANE
ncbi:MAG: alpha/beta hydrolase [Pseudomonadota bacterium]